MGYFTAITAHRTKVEAFADYTSLLGSVSGITSI